MSQLKTLSVAQENASITRIEHMKSSKFDRTFGPAPIVEAELPVSDRIHAAETCSVFATVREDSFTARRRVFVYLDMHAAKAVSIVSVDRSHNEAVMTSEIMN